MTRPLTHERLLEVLDYSIVSGRFYWRIARGGTKVGGRAGSRHCEGYVSIRLDRGLYLAHRLAWFYVTGEWPPVDTDHLNGVRSCNGWHNLRAVTRLVNAQNQRSARTANPTGLLGVTPRRGRFKAQIKARGRTLHLGDFDTAEEAHAVYLAAKRELHEGCTL